MRLREIAFVLLSRITPCAAFAAALLFACGEAADLSAEQMSKVVEAERPTLTPCYEAGLKQKPEKQELRLQVALHIAPDGHVTDVEVPARGALPGMPACLRDAMRRWRFPQAKDATHASLPLIFRPTFAPSNVSDLPTVEQLLGHPVGAHTTTSWRVAAEPAKAKP